MAETIHRRVFPQAHSVAAPSTAAPACADCRFWDRVDFGAITNHYYRDCRMMTDARHDAPVIARGVMDSKGVLTRDDFGCVRHEAR